MSVPRDGTANRERRGGFLATGALLSFLLLTRPPAVGAQEVASAEVDDGAPGTAIVVEMRDFEFSPSRIQVTRGDVVRFVQVSQSPHNVEFRKVPEGTRLGPANATPVTGTGVRIEGEPPPVIGPFLMQKGGTYEIVADESFATGIHEFVCTPHEALGMKGTLLVREDGAATLAPSGRRR